MAVQHPDVSGGGTEHWVQIYAGADNVGHSTGVNFNTQQPYMAFEPNLLVAWRADNGFNATHEWNSGGGVWDTFAGRASDTGAGYDLAENEGLNTVEFQIPLSAINVTDLFRVHVNWVFEGAGFESSYGPSPQGSFVNGAYDPDHSLYHEFSWLLSGDPDTFPTPEMPDAEDVSPGGLVISEIMPNPADCSDADSEYFELYNNSGQAVNLVNLMLSDEVNNDTIAVDFVLGDGEYANMYRIPGGTQCYGFTGDVAYSQFITLNNDGDTLTVSNTSGTIDEVNYHPFGVTPGSALELEFQVAFIKALDRGSRFTNLRLDSGLAVQVPILDRRGRLLLRLRKLGVALLAFLGWALMLRLGVPVLAGGGGAAPERDDQIWLAAFIVIAIWVGLAGYWLFALPMMAATGISGSWFAALLCTVWLPGPPVLAAALMPASNERRGRQRTTGTPPTI